MKGILICIPIVAAIFLIPFLATVLKIRLSNRKIPPERYALQYSLTGEATVYSANAPQAVIEGAIRNEMLKNGFTEKDRDRNRMVFLSGNEKNVSDSSPSFTASITFSDGNITVSVDKWCEKDSLTAVSGQENMKKFFAAAEKAITSADSSATSRTVKKRYS